ncbi:MAG: PHP domain-containing protein [Candidatus Aureabacteria bacterium]|nr:PHP domain-containing protein [Candidatus Auribacterota bacterium]
MTLVRHASRETSHESRVTGFTHLHNHFWGSYSDSVLSVDEGLDRAAALGLTAMAITDHGELALHPIFLEACLKRNMRPILGCECNFVENAARTIESGDTHRNHLILLARDDAGHRNLVSLISESWTNNCFQGQRGLVDWALLEKYHEGLVCLNGCYYGSFPLKIIREGMKAGERELRRYLDIFGEDFHPEMMSIGYELQKISNAGILELVPRYGLKPVITNDVHYPYPEDWIAHDIIIKSRYGSISDFSVETKSIWLKSEQEMLSLGFDSAYIRNTMEVAEKCRVRLHGGIESPPVMLGSAEEDINHLSGLCLRAIEGKVPPADRASWARLFRSEERLIREAGLAGYLLAAAELASYFHRSKKKVALVEGRAGRSAAACLLGLSDPPPDLNAEPGLHNFTNLAIKCPNPGSAIRHLMDRFGPDRVCRVAEMVPIRGGDALLYTAEVLGIPAKEREEGLEEVIKAASVEENISRSAALAGLCQAMPELLKWARRIEGIPRISRPSQSTAAVTGGPIARLLPLKRLGKDIFAQYDAEGARLAGFITLELREY